MTAGDRGGARPGRGRSIAWAGGLRGGAIVARALVGLVLARFLGPAEVGVYFLVVAGGGLVALVARAGLDRLALAEVGRHPDEARTIALALGRRLVATSSLASAAGLGFGLLAPWPDEIDRAAVVLVVVAAVPLNLVHLGANVLRGVGRTTMSLLVGEVAPPVLRLLVFAVLPLSLTATRAAAAFLIGSVVASVVVVVEVLRLPDPDPDPDLDLDPAGRAGPASRWSLTDPWRQTGPLFVVAVAAQLRELATTGLAWSTGVPADVGGLGTATRLEQMSLLPTTATRFVTAPELVSSGSSLAPTVADLARRTARRSMAVQLPVLLAVGLLAPQLLAVLGDDFVPAAGFLRVLVIGGLINAATGSTTQVLLMSDHRRRLAVSGTVGLAVLVVVGALLAQPFGVTGVAVGAAAANAVMGLVEWWFVRCDLQARIDVAAPDPDPVR